MRCDGGVGQLVERDVHVVLVVGADVGADVERAGFRGVEARRGRVGGEAVLGAHRVEALPRGKHEHPQPPRRGAIRKAPS